ncbi:transposase, MuDR, MULE transposase domain protein [Tanacetum coccineum]|uniref:Transposase, MuDR, MULE transposase domain protein n=1 Tax=Tanacetum coccineum TaxID=301880 RepID=A0ABQ4XLA0_9ASTR
MSVLRECIGDNPNLLFISDRPDAIALAVEKEFPLAFHAAYTREDYATNMNTLQIVQPDAHEKLCRAGPERWDHERIVHCALQYMTSNSGGSVNACIKYDVRNNRLGSKQSGKKKMKSATWVVKGVNPYQYEVSDGQYIREVNLQTGICGCRKWQLSGLPCGHVIAITRFLGLTDCVHYVADWFKKPKYQGTYSESIHSLGNMQQWEFPENIQKAIPPRMDNPQPGRPKNTNRIQSQGEEPRIIRCTRCTQTGHRRDQCGHPFLWIVKLRSRATRQLAKIWRAAGSLDGFTEETQNDYTSDQMVEWAEQEHFEYEETNVACPKIDLSSMLIHNNRSKEESFGEKDIKVKKSKNKPKPTRNEETSEDMRKDIKAGSARQQAKESQ